MPDTRLLRQPRSRRERACKAAPRRAPRLHGSGGAAAGGSSSARCGEREGPAAPAAPAVPAPDKERDQERRARLGLLGRLGAAHQQSRRRPHAARGPWPAPVRVQSGRQVGPAAGRPARAGAGARGFRRAGPARGGRCARVRRRRPGRRRRSRPARGGWATRRTGMRPRRAGGGTALQNPPLARAAALTGSRLRGPCAPPH